MQALAHQNCIPNLPKSSFTLHYTSGKIFLSTDDLICYDQLLICKKKKKNYLCNHYFLYFCDNVCTLDELKATHIQELELSYNNFADVTGDNAETISDGWTDAKHQVYWFDWLT